MRGKGLANDVTLLSSYLDGELTAREKEKLERRLRGEPRLKEELDKLRTTRAMLRSLPRKKAPRNFVLTPEMVAQPRKTGWFPAMGLTSAAAAVLALVLVFLQFGPGLLTGGRMAASAPEQEVAMFAEEAAPEAALAQDAEPQVIIWGNPPVSPDIVQGKGGGDGNVVIQAAPVQEQQPAAPADAMQPMTTPTPAPYATAEPYPTEVPPPAAAEAAPAEPEAEGLQAPEPEAVDNAVDPILGVRPPEEAGYMEPLTTERTPADRPFPARQVTTAAIILLSGFSLASGLVAFILWRRQR